MPRSSRPAVLRVLIYAAAVAGLGGCRGGKEPPKAPPSPKVTVAAPTRDPVTEYGEYTGYTEALQRIEIRPQVKGRLMKVHVPEGTEIEKGTLLYEIDPKEYIVAKDRAVAARDRAVADRQRAVAEMDKARADLARAKPLRGSNALSEEQYLQFDVAEKTAVAAVAQAGAAIEQAKAEVAAAELNLGYTKIYAPIGGRVSRTLVTEGNLVGYGMGMNETHLTIMVDVDPIYVYFDVPERDVLEYEGWAKPLRGAGPGLRVFGFPLWTGLWSDAVIPLAVGVETEAGHPHLGWINFREPRFEPGTGTLRLRGILDNTDRKLSSGMYARVKFPKRWPRERLTVPAECVLSGQQGRFVYLAEDPPADAQPPPPASPDPNFVVKRVKGPVTVETGALVGKRVVVKEATPGDAARGLAADAPVIVEGFQKVRPGGYVLVPKKSAGSP